MRNHLAKTLTSLDALTLAFSRRTGRGNQTAAFAALLLLHVFFASASFADEPPAADKPKPIAIAKVDRKTTVDFEKEILPLLRTSCLACHNRNKPKASLVLETPADIRKGGENGPAVAAGKPEESLLLRAASHQIETVMPPKANKVAAPDLTSDQLGLVRLWIEQGAKGELTAQATVAWHPMPQSIRAIYSVALSPDGAWAACGRGNRIEAYRLPKGEPAIRLTDPQLKSAGDGAAHRDLVGSLAFSPDGTRLASGGYREVKIWRRPPDDAAPGEWKLERTIGTGEGSSPLSDRVTALAFSPDGLLLATGGGVPSRGGEIHLWNGQSGAIERSLTEIHSDTVLALEFSHDGRRLASGAADHFVRIMDVETGKVIKSLEGHTHHVLGVSWNRDGNTLASCGADNAVVFWDLEKGEKKKSGNKPTDKFDKELTSIHYLGNTDQVVITGGDGRVRILRESGAEVRSLGKGADFVEAGAVGQDGGLIASGGQDGVLRVWKGKDGQSVGNFTPAEEPAR